VAGAEDASIGSRHQRRAATSGDVDAFVDATAAAGRVVFADRATYPVLSLDREDVAVEGHAAVAAGDASPGRRGQEEEQSEGEKGGALQWCSITRSTMLYSFASSALMK
jgi:hypothetical protein